ncbi:MAG: hypothetical protein WCJ14_00870 [Verrucomicrobiota bacterium]
MHDPQSIVCKPTRWFLFRAMVMLVMFGVFAVLFYLDGSTGYRKKNEVFYLYRAFQQANDDFSRLNADGRLTPEAWQKYARQQEVKLPSDRALLPAALVVPMPWPAILHDYQRMKPLQWTLLWREFTKERSINAVPPEEPYDARKIKEQWVVCGICLLLAAGASLVLVRTLGRSLAADDSAIITPQGRRVPYSDLKTLDLRKWETKGLAFLDFDGASGKGRIRIDGLTYGGFKPENDEPAERLMRLIRSRFSGELIEYAPLREAVISTEGDPKSS